MQHRSNVWDPWKVWAGIDNQLLLIGIFHPLTTAGLAYESLRTKSITFKCQSSRLRLSQLSFARFIFLQGLWFYSTSPETGAAADAGAEPVLEMHLCWCGGDSPLPRTPVLASVQGFVGIPVWVKTEALLHSGLHKERVSASHSSAEASTTWLSRGPATPARPLFPELLGTQHLPPSPGAGCTLATSSADCLSPTLACCLLIRLLR